MENLPDSLIFKIQAACTVYTELHDTADVTIGLPMVDLDIDSDNNGYINTSANPVREKAEDEIEESTPKPITFFPNASTDPNNANYVPPDYMYEPLRVAFDVANHVDVKYSFHYTANIEVYKKIGNTYTKVSSNYKMPIAELLHGEGHYLVKAVGTGHTGFGSGNDKVHLVLWDANNKEMVRDTISVKVAETPTQWIVPRGWHIEDNTFTTPTPATEDTIGPKTEGTGVTTYNGDAYSVTPYENGFTLEFNYAFKKNMTAGYPTGYVQPDICVDANAPQHRNEHLDAEDRHQMNFFGNSGVKIFGMYEIQIFDTCAMVDGMNITSADVNNGVINNMTINKPVNGRQYTGEPVNQVISGIAYGKGSYGYADLMSAYTRQSANGTNYMKIWFRKDGSSYRIRVFGKDASNNEVQIFNDSGITNGTGPTNSSKTLASADKKHVMLQSHWGSGVTFSNVTIGAPPSQWW